MQYLISYYKGHGVDLPIQEHTFQDWPFSRLLLLSDLPSIAIVSELTKFQVPYFIRLKPFARQHWTVDQEEKAGYSGEHRRGAFNEEDPKRKGKIVSIRQQQEAKGLSRGLSQVKTVRLAIPIILTYHLQPATPPRPLHRG